MRKRAAGFAGVVSFFLLLAACASHAPTIECDKRLAPINVGETHKDTTSAEKPKP
jgi:hypothetical protein